MTPPRNTQAYLDSQRSQQEDADFRHLALAAKARNAVLLADVNRSLERLAEMAVK